MSEVLESQDDRRVRSPAELAAWLEAGSRPAREWRIGTEHEKFGFRLDDLSPLPYEGEHGIRRVLEELARRFAWVPITEGETLIGLKQPGCSHGCTITLEPGGQLELSGEPLESIHETCSEVNRHLAQVREVSEAMGIGFLGLGFSPKWSLAETPRMPKGRYAIMSAYMPKVGRHGLDMMYRSCTVQVNLDFSDEADMVKKMRVSLALQPVVTAIFANSPFADGKPTGFLSYRSEVWRHTDPDRTGMLPFAFEEGFGFEAYVDYVLDVPMYFVYRDGRYVDVAGASFRDFLAGRLEALPGERPTLDDWADHLSTAFPEVRLKRYLEMRGADGGPWRKLCALPALWTGLLYDGAALDAAWALVKDWSAEERQGLRDRVPRTALKTPFRGGTVQDIARDVVAIALDGLKARGREDSLCSDERQYLAGVQRIVESGRTPAEALLERYETDWQGDIDRIFLEMAY